MTSQIADGATAVPSTAASTTQRKRGRPPRNIDDGAVVAAIERLFSEGGIDAVTIERTAVELRVSRATLYRSVPSKAHLLGILFVRMTDELDRNAARAIRATDATPKERLTELIRVQIEAAVRMRDYFFVFFDGSRLPRTVHREWRRWTRRHEQVWIDAVAEAIDTGALPPGDPRLTTRMILGMLIWIAHWFRASEGITTEQIQAKALELVGFTREQR